VHVHTPPHDNVSQKRRFLKGPENGDLYIVLQRRIRIFVEVGGRGGPVDYFERKKGGDGEEMYVV
jgi:hypothetical protein